MQDYQHLVDLCLNLDIVSENPDMNLCCQLF